VILLDKEPQERDGYRYFIEKSKDLRAVDNENWRLGFESLHRNLDIKKLAENIFSKLNFLSHIDRNDIVLDIGAGGGELAFTLQEIYTNLGAKYIMIDLPEVLKLGKKPLLEPIFGPFPINIDAVNSRILDEGGSVKHIIANSILHYVKFDQLTEGFFHSITEVLSPGGTAFVGDVPCREMKIAQSKAENRPFEDSDKNFSYVEIAEIASLCAKSGSTIYTIPQPREFPMSPHRLDLIVFKNEESSSWN
jgi:hypothetical protein